MNQDFTPAERFALALEFAERMGADDAAFVRAAYQYQVDRETLEAQYDLQTLRWAASRGYDF